MTERRFNEEEVATIFQLATEAQQTPGRQLPSGDGLTLVELQEIGRQIGIPPELVLQAAASFGQVGSATTRRLLGLPIGVGRTIEFDRKLSEDEWDRLVVDLRETFDARGSVRREGSFREWSNGNLHALLEPTANGDRLRLRTLKGDSRAWIRGGLITLGIAGVAAVVGLVGGSSHHYLILAGEIAIIAAGQFAIGAIGLPSWARLRRRQMEEISGRLPLTLPSLASQDFGA